MRRAQVLLTARMPTANKVMLLTPRVRKRWHKMGSGGPREEGRCRCVQRWCKRMKSKYWSRERPSVVEKRKRRKLGKVVCETQFEVQGQWWSILGMHLEFGLEVGLWNLRNVHSLLALR
jgi:hypothetical protein